MITTKKRAIEYKHQEMRKKFKHFTIRKHQLNTKKDSRAGNERQKL